ncbi:hypothetical protein [Streptomyces sp. AgN23]|uniref:hypothetical protein n=1 Tax=Streptomyces sp. AgN23 TaxID=1188315 RepID=UPI001B31D5A2|nr:hypothetical protein [Streptomyces sp. AgN23]QTI90547.1 hypothetical protein AS97_60655 [Streptomyces sp. AgN23]WTB11153.1 hypothetical protein OG546_47980 [Streptomyces antimycoticus]
MSGDRTPRARALERALYDSGLPTCWAGSYAALRDSRALERAVRHTAASLALMPAAYRWGTVAALRLFPVAFRAVTWTSPHSASPERLRHGLGQLRARPGYADVLRATTALALYGALDGTAPRPAHPPLGAVR